MIIRKEAAINKNYREHLFARLRARPDRGMGYINTALAGCEYRVFLLALYDVIDAFGGLEYFSRESGISMEKLDRIIDEIDHLEVDVLEALVGVLGWEIAATVPHIILRQIATSADPVPQAV